MAMDKEKLRIRLELTEANKVNEDWELTAIATVIDPKWPVPNIEIQFYHNGKAFDSPIATDGEGRTIKEFVSLKNGAHTIEAQIIGTTTKARQVKQLKEVRPKKPAKIICHPRGSKGKYDLMFQVLAEDDSPVKGAVVRILDIDNPSGFVDLTPTDKDGVIDHKIEFTEKEKIFTIMVLGTPISIWKNLFN